LAITLLNAETQSTPAGVAVNNMIPKTATQRTLQYVLIVKKAILLPPKKMSCFSPRKGNHTP